MLTQEKVALRERTIEEAYKELLKPPIQFPLRLDSPIRNDCNNSSFSSQVGNGDNQMEVSMDDYLQDMTSMEAMLFDAFQNDELGDDAHIIDTLFRILKSTSTAPLFGPGGKPKSTQLGTTMLLYNVKVRFGMSNACFSEILR